MSDTHIKPNHYWELSLLIAQNAALSIFMKASTSRPEGSRPSLPSAVLAAEIIKFFSCCAILLFQDRRGIEISKHIKHTSHAILDLRSSMIFATPATMYVVQNLLQYVASSHLDVASYQIFSQLKLFTAAIWGYILLGRALTVLQWLGLVLAATGVAISQVSITGEAMHAFGDKRLGVLSMIAACIFSGFAGVLTEKLIKKYDKSLVLCNAQMALYSLPVTLLSAYTSNGNRIRQQGLFYNFDGVVGICILLQVLGGFLVSWCLKYTDSNSKNVAVSMAIMVAAIAAAYIFDEPITIKLLLGAPLVVLAIWTFIRGSERKLGEQTCSSV